MPELKGTSADPLRRVGWRGTLVSSYAMRNLVMQTPPYGLNGLLYMMIKQGLNSCAWTISESFASQGLYHVGIIEAELVLDIGLAGCDLVGVCAVRNLREANLGLDELEYYRAKMAERILYELRELLTRPIDRYIRSLTGVASMGTPTIQELEAILGSEKEAPKLLSAPQRPARNFEIVQRTKLKEA